MPSATPKTRDEKRAELARAIRAAQETLSEIAAPREDPGEGGALVTATDQVCLEKAAADALAGALDGLTSALEASGAIDKSVVAKLDVAAALQLELGEAIQTIGDRLPQAR